MTDGWGWESSGLGIKCLVGRHRVGQSERWEENQDRRQPVKTRGRGSSQGEKPPELRVRVSVDSMEILAHGGQGRLYRVDNSSKEGGKVGKTWICPWAEGSPKKPLQPISLSSTDLV